MKAAEATGKEIVVRKSDKGWLVGMSTPGSQVPPRPPQGFG